MLSKINVTSEKYSTIHSLISNVMPVVLRQYDVFVHFNLGMAPRGIIRVKTWIASSCGLPPSEITFAGLTRQAGYRNGFIGGYT